MKATISQTDLFKWLSVVGRVVPNRGQLPVLSNVLIEADKDGLVLSATNLEIGLRVEVGGKVSTPGAITVPAKNLSEFVGSLPCENVELEAIEEKLKVECGKLAANFSGISASEFPVLSKPGDKERKVFKLKKKIWEEVAVQVAFCSAADESRPVLTGVMFTVVENSLKITATDGFRLSRKVVELEKEMSGFEKGLIIPARTIIETARILQEGKKTDLEMGMVGEGNQMLLNYDGVQISSRILEGNFPDVEKIIPAAVKIEALVDKEELLRAVKAVGIFARDSANVIKIKIDEGKMVLSASSSATGDSLVEVEAQTKGGEGQIAFNYRYMLDFLNSVSGERVSLGMNDSLAPGVFGVENEEGLVHLIMPVRV